MAFPDLDPVQVFRDFVTDKVPSSGKWNPRKPEIRRLLKSYESALIALIAGQGGDIELARGVISFAVTGGTENDIIAEPDSELPDNPGSAVYILGGVEQTNTGNVTINDKPLLTNSGNQIAAGGLVADGIYLFLDDGASYRLVSDQASAAIVAAAETAKEGAEQARDAALSAQPQAFPLTRADMEALPDTTANAYLKEAGFQGYFDQVDAGDPALADLIAADTVGGEIKVKSANPTLAYLRQRKYGDLIKTSEFGHDLAVSLAVAGERRKMFGPGTRVDLLANHVGTLVLTGGLIIPEGVNFISDKHLVLDASALTDGSMINAATGLVAPGGRNVIDARPLSGVSRAGHYTELPAFQAIAAGEQSVLFDAAHGLVVGNVCVWHSTVNGSWNPARNEYRLSMRRTIVAVDGLRVWLDKPARDAFAYSANLKAYRQATMSGRFGGFTVDLGSNPLSGTQAVYLLGLDGRSEVDRIRTSDAAQGGIAIVQSLDVRPSALWASTRLTPSAGSVYPIQLQNCTNVRVRDSDGFSNWHSLAMTGAGGTDVGQTINEDCWYEDCRGYNSGALNVAGLEMHGNSDRCGFLNCEGSGVILAGRDASLVGGTIDNMTTSDSAQAKLIVCDEMHSGRYLVEGTRFKSSRNTGPGSLGGAIYAPTSPNQVDEVYLDFVGVSIDAPLEQRPIRIGNAVINGKKISLSFDGAVNCPAAAALVLIMNGNFAVTSSYFRIERAAGLTAGVQYAVSQANGDGGHMQFGQWKFPAQRYVYDTAGAAAASELLPAAAAQTLRHPFPVSYQPTATAFLQSGSLGLKASARVAAVTPTTVRAQVATDDGSNYSAAVAKVAVVVE